jgi:hypothetical protein
MDSANDDLFLWSSSSLSSFGCFFDLKHSGACTASAHLRWIGDDDDEQRKGLMRGELLIDGGTQQNPIITSYRVDRFRVEKGCQSTISPSRSRLNEATSYKFSHFGTILIGNKTISPVRKTHTIGEFRWISIRRRRRISY